MIANMQGRKGDWIQTFSEVAYWPLDPHPDEVLIEDIAHALSLQCRFAGHCRYFYSVAEHCWQVSYLVPRAIALQGLLHDATEAYLVDVPRPVKRELGGYLDIEALNWEVIAKKFRVPVQLDPLVKQADNDILISEQQQLFKREVAPWNIPGKAVTMAVYGWQPNKAEKMFLRRFYDLTN